MIFLIRPVVLLMIICSVAAPTAYGKDHLNKEQSQFNITIDDNPAYVDKI